MAKGLATLRRRITSVKSTKKVTKAMQMIATTKLKVWKQSLLDARLYAQHLVELVQKHLLHEDIRNLVYFKDQPELPTLHLLITSNLGLCGSYNATMIQATIPSIKQDDLLLVIGLKGFRLLKKQSVNLIDTYVELNVLDTSSIRPMIDDILQRYQTKTIGRVQLHYAQFVNSLVFNPQTLTLLPLSITESKEAVKPIDVPLIEPDALTVFEQLLPLYLKNTVFSSLIEAQVSEQSSRRNAMEKASDNADELVDQLQLDYNKQRQANITQEIAEIIGGTTQ
jgi:F-type H+-transporting ATPase subunit gamma